MTEPPDFWARLDALFADDAVEIRELIEAFEVDAEPEQREQVLEAILTLCGGKRPELERLLKVAKRDYREVLIMRSDSSASE